MSELPIALQDVRKRDNKTRTFAPPDNTINPSFLESADKEQRALKKLLKLEPIDEKLDILSFDEKKNA